MGTDFNLPSRIHSRIVAVVTLAIRAASASVSNAYGLYSGSDLRFFANGSLASSVQPPRHLASILSDPAGQVEAV